MPTCHFSEKQKELLRSISLGLEKGIVDRVLTVVIGGIGQVRFIRGINDKATVDDTRQYWLKNLEINDLHDFTECGLVIVSQNSYQYLVTLHANVIRSFVENDFMVEDMSQVTKGSQDSRAVFVVHGRNIKARDALFEFLRAVDLKPMEWSQAISITGKGAPYIGEVLETVFLDSKPQAVVVVMTPEDEVRLHPTFQLPNDPPHETQFTLQPRPNVIFEAGMAIALFPERTILVKLGSIRPFSDIDGRHFIRMDNSPAKRKELAQRLERAGCNIDIRGDDWLNAGDFEEPTENALQAIGLGIIQDKSGDLFWLPVDMISSMRLLSDENAPKAQIDHGLLKCYFHASKLEISDRDIVERLRKVQKEVSHCSEGEFTIQRRRQALAQLESIFNDVGKLAEKNQPGFDPGPDLI